MRASTFGDRRITKPDFTRLEQLATSGDAPQLAELLDEAEVLPAHATPSGVVTLDARIIVRDPKLQHRRILVVCHPADADASRGRISVLSPAGLGLIGLDAGKTACWRGPGGIETLAEIEQVLCEAEAATDVAR